MSRLMAWLTVEHWLIGASLMRVSLGVWAIYYYVLHWSVRRDLWGPGGVLPFEKFLETGPRINLFQWHPSPLYFEAVYVAAIVVAAAVAVGYRSRLTVPLHWLAIWSLQERNQLLGDGGDNIMRIALLFLALVNTGACFSFDAARSLRAVRAAPDAGRWGWRRAAGAFCERNRPAVAVIHNFGVLLILAQLSLLYLSTGLYKVMGELWQSGTALYYILRVDEFSWPGAEAVYRNPYLVVLGTYGTVWFEVLFLPSLFNRWTRCATIVAGIAFHASIGLVMGLVTFAWSMVSIYPLLVTDEEYAMADNWLRRRFRLTALYDGWCPACLRSVRWLSRCDLLSLIEFASFRDEGVVGRYGIAPERAARRIHTVDAAGRVREGIDAMIAIAGRTIVLWPLVPVFWVARVAAGQRPYDVFASRRLVVIPGACAEHCLPRATNPGVSDGSEAAGSPS
jgi:predicted DCC family thiol-disulfide oxidoreductase YuxK